MNTPLLHAILHIESASYQCEAMRAFLIAHAEEKKYDWDTDVIGNLYLTKGLGDTYPCMVAHMDTVHDIHGEGISLVTFGDCITGFNEREMTQCGVGGDDKCGIYAALHCMEKLPLCKVVFFVDEEVGCDGSYDCDLEFFLDCRFVLQADRKGNDDFVTDISGPLASKKFIKDCAPILKKYGYSPCHGMMSDVMALRDNKVGISVANMSAGYYNPHCDNEYIDVNDLERVCLMMEEMGRTLTKSYPFTYEKPLFSSQPSKLLTGGNGVVAYDKNGKLVPLGSNKFPDWEKVQTRGTGWAEEEEELGADVLNFYSKQQVGGDEEGDEIAQYEAEMLAREYARVMA